MLLRPPTSTLFPYTTLFRSFPLELASWPSLEAQVAAIADDIAYDNHDIDDGLRAGLLQLDRSEEHTSELQSRENLVCRLLLEKKNQHTTMHIDATLSLLTSP